MKRFVWLLLAAFCLALGQVPAVNPVVRPKHGDCCGCHGRCGMPGCALPVAHAPSVFVGEGLLTVARPAAGRTDPRRRTFVEKFYAAIVAPDIDRAGWPQPRPGASPASVPLFKAHCSFLI